VAVQNEYADGWVFRRFDGTAAEGIDREKFVIGLLRVETQEISNFQFRIAVSRLSVLILHI
jgi:hypothetical protein